MEELRPLMLACEGETGPDGTEETALPEEELEAAVGLI